MLGSFGLHVQDLQFVSVRFRAEEIFHDKDHPGGVTVLVA